MNRAPVRILLVEDNPGDARLLVELLAEAEGGPFVVREERTLAAALRAVGGCDVVLLDLSLPDGHGLETVQRTLAAAPEVPVVVLTGNRDDRLATQVVQSGAQDYLFKGEVTPTLISRTVRYAIERKKAEESARQLFAAQVARSRSEESARRAQFLAEIGGTSLASLEAEEMARRLSRAVVPFLADACFVHLEDGTGALRAIAHAAPEGFVFDDRAALGRSLASRRPVLAPVPLDEARPQARALVVPMVVRDRGIGALSLIALDPKRPLDTDEESLAEEVARRAALAFENARLYEETRAAVRTRDEILAVVSHDLRNPLSVFGLSLIALRRKLADGDAVARVADILNTADRSYRRMVRLLSDLLDVARIDRGQLPLERQPSDLGDLVAEAVELQRPLAAEKAISLTFTSSGPCPARVDRERIAQLMGNLLGNAIKFTPAAGVVRVGVARAGDRIEVIVADTGPGIPPEHLPHIFDRFWQQGQSRREGIGLGLAIAKGIVEAHGGELTAESPPGQGATFAFRLPVEAGDRPPSAV